MKRLLVLTLLVLSQSKLVAQKSTADIQGLSNRYYHAIEAPISPLKWEAWRKELKGWKDSILSVMNYNDAYYRRPEYAWASKAYSTMFVVAHDRALFDENWNYQIESYLRKYEVSYGGVDVVLLWPTYPQLGFDNRDQYEFYRNLPGGTAALRKLSDDLHRMGKKLFIAYNPWDNIARKNGKVDEVELIKLVREINADGIFLDTISIVEGFREKLNEVRPGVVFQSEIGTAPAMLAEIHQSWLETAWSPPHKNLEFAEVPFVMRNRWLEQRHMIYRLSRSSHEQSTVIQNAWINGCGVVIWENVFGTVNELNQRDRSLLNAMLPIQRQYADFFTRGKWTPLVHTIMNRTFASLWEFDGNRLWTVINRQEQRITGKLFETDHVEGTRYFDLVTGTPAKIVVNSGKATIYTEFRPKAIGCIVALRDKELTPGFYEFLARQAKSNGVSNFDNTHSLPGHVLKSVTKTRLYSKDNIPEGMKIISAPPDSVTMEFHFRRRECGFYPMEGVVDHSYAANQLDQEVTGIVHAKPGPFAMDETHVTNSQYEKFIRATKYQSAYTQNFLKHWVGGRPPKGREDHPVTWITLDDARAYAKWLGKRLPTEAEWQWAAQNGEQVTAYPWGNSFDSTQCNIGRENGTTAVKKFNNGRTKSGLYDMSGNVWQLTESERNDGYNSYCILRGGSWYITRASGWYADQGPQKTNFGAKYLFTWPGLDRCGTVGFRCVVDLD